MKKLSLLAAIVAASLLTSHVVRADTSIGVIDTRKIVEESDAGKSLASQLKARQQKIQAEATEFEKKLKAEEQDIIAKRKDMKPEEFAAKKKSFEQEFNKSRTEILSKSADLDGARKKSLAELQKGLAKAAADVADEKKLQLIVDRQFVILAQENMDVTKDVMAKLNASVKSITLGGK